MTLTPVLYQKALRVYTAESPILGTSQSIPTQALRLIRTRPHGLYTAWDIATGILPRYYELCRNAGIPFEFAVAQCIHETNNFSSWWAARPRRNPAGLGVNGQTHHEEPKQGAWAWDDERNLWVAGLSFGAWSDSIACHIGRLLAYVLPCRTGTAAQQQLIAQALVIRPMPDSLRGSAPCLYLLGKVHNPTGMGWASPGTTYGAKIAIWANRILDS